jgi:hypothetical protein
MRTLICLLALSASLLALGSSLPGCSPADGGKMESGKMDGAMDKGKMESGKMDGAMDKGKMESGKMDGAMDSGKMESGKMDGTPK